MRSAKKSSNQQGDGDLFHEGLRKKLIEYGAMAFPIAITNLVVLWVMNKFFLQPWQVLWFVLPLAALVWLAWKRITGGERFRLGRPFLVLFSSYILIFSLAAGTDLLNWRRSLVGYEKKEPRNFLSLNWAGDWRYFVARQVPASAPITIVTLEEAQTRAAARYDIARFIRLAVQSGGTGIAFDFYFNENSSIDEFLCDEIKRATVPVFVGYGFNFIDSELTREEIAPNLSKCIPPANQGHLVGYSESDGKIRMIPLYFKNNSAREALSLKISQKLSPSTQEMLPLDGLVQFIKPQKDFPEIKYEDLIRDPDK